MQMNKMKELNIGGLVIPVPIIQGGMGVGISLSGLASAVADEGGVGVISAAGLGMLYKSNSSDYLENCIFGLKEEIKKARQITSFIIFKIFLPWIGKRRSIKSIRM